MRDKIQHTVKHTLIYGVGNIATKLVGVILLPLYTEYISLTEYGILGIIEITVLIATQVLVFGFPQAYLRFYDIDEFREKRESLLSTILAFLVVVGLVIEIFVLSFSNQIASVFERSSDFQKFIELSVHIIFLRIISATLLNALRAENRSGIYAFSNVLRLVFTLFCNIYFIAFLGWGLNGILYSYIIGEAVLIVIVVPTMLKRLTLSISFHFISPALAFGIPLIFTGFAHMLLNIGDRYIIKLLINYEEVGLYDLGYRIAGILNTLVIQSFSLGFLPIAYKYYGQPGDKRYYQKLMTYYFFAVCWAGLALSIFSENIIKTFALNQDFFPAYTVVPLIVLGYVFSGGNTIANIGLYLKQKTKIIAYNTIFAALLNIALNFILVPELKMKGAAMATVMSFVILYMVSIYFANRSYKIKYEFGRISYVLILTISLYLISLLIPVQYLPIEIILKIILLILFPLIMYLLKFYEPVELESIVKIWQRMKHPKNWFGS